jgi:hypothetical protein
VSPRTDYDPGFELLIANYVIAAGIWLRSIAYHKKTSAPLYNSSLVNPHSLAFFSQGKSP